MKMENVNENTQIEVPAIQVAPVIVPPTPTTPDAGYYPIGDLPSKYRLYPEGTLISARPLKVLEVKQLSNLNEDNANFIINDILKKCIRGIEIEKLLSADKLYILFWLRANTYKDSGYEIKFNCNLCNQDSSYNFTVDTLEPIYLSDDYNADKVLDLPVSKHKILTRCFPILKDETDLDAFKKTNKKSLMILDDDVLAVAQLIITINGETKPTLDKYRFLTNLQPSDYAYIEGYIADNAIGIKNYINAKCNKCGGTTPVGVSFQADFFVPHYNFK